MKPVELESRSPVGSSNNKIYGEFDSDLAIALFSIIYIIKRIIILTYNNNFTLFIVHLLIILKASDLIYLISRL
jgi:hypothetical protein